MSNNKIAPSILAADYANFASELKRIEETSAEYVHIDIMDGQFVNNISLGFGIIRTIRELVAIPLDVHLMILRPDWYIERCVQFGADKIREYLIRRNIGRQCC